MCVCVCVCECECECVCTCVPVYKKKDRLAGLVDKASISGAEDPGFESCLRQDFSRSSHTSQ